MSSIDHVGVAVGSLSAARPFFEDVLGLSVAYEWENPDLDVQSVFYVIGDAFLEVVQHGQKHRGPSHLGAAEARIDHVAIRVSDLDGLVGAWQAQGIRFEKDVSRTGLRPTGRQKDIFFAAPGATGHVRYQLVERLDDEPA